MHNLPATNYTQSTPQGWSSRGGGKPLGGEGRGRSSNKWPSEKGKRDNVSISTNIL